ncbi:hypothetical protein TSAR_014906 [Trichomalopsis sarcophagae]|uniref:Uncharacterized protein n=1 Tax=Trichomalopsis sarcophagae TaxID=543379 RepID=A0A232F2D7_9HYME|nr:hypothetical protein TSAR_014906 [Trichomalopsis sarcophagae]
MLESPKRTFNYKGFKYNEKTVFKLPSKAKVLIRIPSTKDYVRGEAYLQRIITVQEVYLGETAVTNENRYCYAMVINTRVNPVEIEITLQYLEPFNLNEDDEFLEFPLEGEPITDQNERVKFIVKKYKLRKSNTNTDTLSQNPMDKRTLEKPENQNEPVLSEVIGGEVRVLRIVRKPTKTFSVKPNLSKVQGESQTSFPDGQRKKLGRKLGSENAVLTAPKSMESGKMNLDASTIAMQLNRKGLPLIKNHHYDKSVSSSTLRDWMLKYTERQTSSIRSKTPESRKKITTAKDELSINDKSDSDKSLEKAKQVVDNKRVLLTTLAENVTNYVKRLYFCLT